jgi:hypothetical protein
VVGEERADLLQHVHDVALLLLHSPTEKKMRLGSGPEPVWSHDRTAHHGGEPPIPSHSSDDRRALIRGHRNKIVGGNRIRDVPLGEPGSGAVS